MSTRVLNPEEFDPVVGVVNQWEVSARVAGTPVGSLSLGDLSMATGGREVENVSVQEPFRRRGVATRMWEAAVGAGLEPVHSDSRSVEGDAWAESVGGYLPYNEYPWEGEDDG